MRAKMRHKELDVEAVLDKSITALQDLDASNFLEEAINAALQQLSQEQGFIGAGLMTPLRYALTGCKVSYGG